MTTKEMSLAVLDRIEQLETERAALIAHLDLIRYADGRQPDLKALMADSTTLESVKARNAELRQSILCSTDGTSAASALVEGLMEHWK